MGAIGEHQRSEETLVTVWLTTVFGVGSYGDGLGPRCAIGAELDGNHRPLPNRAIPTRPERPEWIISLERDPRPLRGVGCSKSVVRGDIARGAGAVRILSQGRLTRLGHSANPRSTEGHDTRSCLEHDPPIGPSAFR